MIIQKIYRNGNSLAITIPQQYLKDLDLQEGSEIVVEKDKESLRIAAKKKVLAPDVDVKFMKMLDSFIVDHEDVLRNLAKK
ncbi:MAG: AbrB/MazE/SpoVT family DNA-binding domain-containing protein [Patescibacteria group bacterium]|nr:AbrB/MazE/SpoVT family DNA-binding domain-containing protein [Patescibacteria group bacterium]MDE2590157.1 AbrB/MazE/SpoVT family DNA-binding domain-containing protein [Patescibacteria group bacterium]